MKRLTFFIALACSVAAPNFASAAIELISNGDFSAGLTGWTVVNQAGGSGNWFIDAVGTTTPVSGSATSASGVFGATPAGNYAVTDQASFGAHALLYAFTVPSVAESVILTFDMFLNDQSGLAPLINPAGLDFTAPRNQHARVDILDAISPALDTGMGVLSNLFIGDDAGANPNPFTRYTFDLTSLVGAGGTFQLRFAEVDNVLLYQMGIDNVSIQFTETPEPMTLAVWSTLATLGGVIAWRKTRV